jgi:iron transport multicopper oxidase
MKLLTRVDSMNPGFCISVASARLIFSTTYHYAAVEYGRECYGATDPPPAPTSLIGSKACTMTCKGNIPGGAVETCGGRLQYNLYASVTDGSSAFPTPPVTVNAV